jgi:hypothetical protein
MLKMEERGGVWRASIVGRPAVDLRGALEELSRALDGARSSVDDLRGDLETGEGEPEALDLEIGYASYRGLTAGEVERWEHVDATAPTRRAG